jgi:hypothetical protein
MTSAKTFLPTLSLRFGVKPETSTMKAICCGIVSGMLADRFQGRLEAAYEAAIRPVLLAVCQKRRFSVSLEFKLPKEHTGAGSHKKIDALLVYGQQAIALEVKTIRPNTRSFSIQEDLNKLQNFAAVINRDKENLPRFSAWQIVAWDDLSMKRKNKQGKAKAIPDQQRVEAFGVDAIVNGFRKAGLVVEPVSTDLLAAKPRINFQQGQMMVMSGHICNAHDYCAAICVHPAKS